jgi:excisionase family DNA binding protein
MPADIFATPAPPIPPLLLTPREAAKALAVCEKTLYTLTAPRGPLPCVRLGRAVRYSVVALRDFIAEGGAK